MARGNPEAYRPPYENAKHNELWDQLHKPAGDPDQIDGLSAHWSNPIRSTLDDFVLDLDRDLTHLMEYWSVATEGGAEFKRRMDLVIEFADKLATHIGTIKDNLDDWSGFLREAQAAAPDPSDTDDSGRTVAGAAIGTAVAGPIGGVIGGMIGHSQDKEQQEEARGKIIDVIAKLAMEYDERNEVEDPPPIPPIDLPDTTGGDNTDIKDINGSSVPKATGFETKPSELSPKSPYANTGTGTGTGDGSDPSGLPVGDSSLQGAGPGTLTGIGAGATGGLGLGGVGGGATITGAGAGGGAGLFAGAAGAGAGAGRGASPGGLSSGPSGSNSGNGNSAKPGSTGNPGPTGRRGQGEDDEEDEHDTWLTEDDMLWGTENDTAPVVFAKQRADEDAVGEIQRPETGSLGDAEDDRPLLS